MINVIRIKYDDERKWISSKNKIKEILRDPYTPELDILALDENNKYQYLLLTDLEGKKVIVDLMLVEIPISNDFFNNPSL
jgi:hypothetical protein